MTTLEILLAILGIIAITVIGGVVFYAIIAAILPIWGKDIKKEKKDKRERYYKDDVPNNTHEESKQPTRELYYHEEVATPAPVLEPQKEEQQQDVSSFNYEVALKEEEELAKLKREEEEVKHGKFARTTFESFVAPEPPKPKASKEDRISEILEDYKDEVGDSILEKTDNYEDVFSFNKSDSVNIVEPESEEKTEDYFDFLNDEVAVENKIDAIEPDKLLKLEEEIEVLKKEIKKEKDADEKEKLKAELNEIVLMKEDLMKAIEEANAEQARIKAEKEQKEKEFSAKSAEVEALKEELEKTKAALQAEAEVNDEEITRLKDELQLARLNKANEAEIIRLKTELDGHRNEKTSEAIEQLKAELDKLKKERDTIERAVVDKLKEEMDINRIIMPNDAMGIADIDYLDNDRPAIAEIEAARIKQKEITDSKFREIETEIKTIKDDIKREKNTEEKDRLKAQLNEILAAREDLIAAVNEANIEQMRIKAEKEDKERELKYKALEIERLRQELENARLYVKQDDAARTQQELELMRLNKHSEAEIIRLKAELIKANQNTKGNEEIERLKLALDEANQSANININEEINRLNAELERVRKEKEAVESEVVLKLKEELEFYKQAAITAEAKNSSEPEVIKEQVFVKGFMTKDEIESKIAILEERLKENDKEWRKIKRDYIPLDRVRRTLESDIKKLRRKEAIVAKQNVILYGVNNYVDINDEKAKKLTEELELLDGLRMSVKKCEEVLAKNKDRLPTLEHANNILRANDAQIRADIEELAAQLERLK